MTTFFLVRHGATAHTGQKLSGWLPDVHLTDEGRAQAEAAADYLARLPLKAVYSSPIDRTMETARPIADRHGLRVQTRRTLGEVEFGRWTDRSFKTLRRTKLWGVVQRFPSGARFPDGESLLEVQQRAVREVELLRMAHPRDSICCVSHADTIRLVVAHYLGVHIDLFQRIEVGAASITVIAVGDQGPRILAVNFSPIRLTSEEGLGPPGDSRTRRVLRRGGTPSGSR
ncbi:MAG: histidine phosphatase family protein [Actinomycetota bacterium]|nr:histidine phosphatase family protein [Actinomycetota bacterium]